VKNILIIFIKNPVPGQVKTRMAREIGSERACSIYKTLTEAVYSNVSKDNSTYECRLMADSHDSVRPIRDWLNPKWKISVQEGDTLGLRMHHAFAEVLQAGYKRGVLVGTDIPGLTQSIIEKAFTELEQVDVVLGPAIDGGYYLIGLKQESKFLFESIKWGTSNVLEKTIQKIENKGKKYKLVKKLRDIDSLEDLRLENFCNYPGL
jgi:rSAM/selenodomain-associated transferase 1